MIQKENTCSAAQDSHVTDPFDEPLELNHEESLVFNDVYFAAARSSINIDGMNIPS